MQDEPDYDKGGNENHWLLRVKMKWWYVFDSYKIGVIPLPLFILSGGIVAWGCFNNNLSNDIVAMVVTLAFFGFACGELGKRLPLVDKMGAAAICATFIPSALVYYGLLPQAVVVSVSAFYHDTNILYLYICCIIVGSTLSMDRRTLIQGFLRIIVPMLCGEIMGMLMGMTVGNGAVSSVFLLGVTHYCRDYLLLPKWSRWNGGCRDFDRRRAYGFNAIRSGSDSRWWCIECVTFAAGAEQPAGLSARCVLA